MEIKPCLVVNPKTSANTGKYCVKKHFEKDCFFSKLYLKLKPEAVPSIFDLSVNLIKIKNLDEHNYCLPANHELYGSNDHTYAISCNSQRFKLDQNSTICSDDNIQQEIECESVSIEEFELIKRNRHLELSLAAANKKIKELETENELLKKDSLVNFQNKKVMDDLFEPDQILYLKNRKQNLRGFKWSSKTLQLGIKCRYACGQKGYNFLKDAGFPLPSLRTLQERTEQLSFNGPFIEDVFNLLEVKVSTMSEEEKFCALLIDEMSLTPCKEIYDKWTDSMVGCINLPGHSGLATKALVVMLCGISTRWKQVVAYWFTGNSCDGSVFKDLILKTIIKAKKVGLHVCSVTSDMGSSNQAMWLEFGMKIGKNSSWVTSVANPSWEGEDLHFIADGPHLIKNVRNCLCNGGIIILPDYIVKNEQFKSNQVSIEFLKSLVDYELEQELKAANKLKEYHLNPGHFEKMRVSTALRVISQDISNTIYYYVEKKVLPPEALPTAWFLKRMRKWFDLISSRTTTLALSNLRKDKYQESIQYINDTIELMKDIKIAGKLGKVSWKPIQTGIILTSISILKLQKFFLDRVGFNFLLTSRFSQDALENFFSLVRTKNPVPSAREFRYALKSISLGQFFKEIKNGSYEHDEGQDLLDFKDVFGEKKYLEDAEFNIPELKEYEIRSTEKDVLSYIAGSIIKKTLHQKTVCSNCKAFLLAKEVDSMSLTSFKEYKNGCLLHVSNEALNSIFIPADRFFRSQLDENFTKNKTSFTLTKIYMEKFNKLTSKFQQEKIKDKSSMSSKSQEMRTKVK